MPKLLTREQFIKVLPRQMKKNVSDMLVNEINSLIMEPELRESFRENLLSYTNVMQNGKFRLSSYISAVKYVSFKLMGDSNTNAYIKAFPDRYTHHVKLQTEQKDFASMVSSYNKTKLVNLIFAQTMVPSYVLNANMYQDALNVQADLMLNARSEKVRTDAANSLLSHLKMPETQKVQLEIGVREDNTINELRQTTLKLVEQQKLMLTAGAMAPKEIAHSKLEIQSENSLILEGEYVKQ